MQPPLHCLLSILALSVLVGCGRRVEDRDGAHREEKKNVYVRKEDSINSGKERTNRVKVEGTVTLDGEKLGRVMVMFIPVKKGEGKPAFGVTDEEGAFELSTSNPGDGAVPGEYKVVVTENAAGSKEKSANKDKPRKQIPKNYTEPNATSLIVQIEPGEEKMQIKLQSE